MEERLRFEEKRFRAIAENSLDLIVLLNREGVVTYINPAIEKTLGFKPEERLGANGLDLVHPDDIKSLTDKFNILATDTNSPVIYGETRLRHKNGRWYTFETVGSNLVSCQSRIVISTAGRNLRFLSREDSFEMTEYR